VADRMEKYTAGHAWTGSAGYAIAAVSDAMTEQRTARRRPRRSPRLSYRPATGGCEATGRAALTAYPIPGFG
jgi:hypothetical protein